MGGRTTTEAGQAYLAMREGACAVDLSNWPVLRLRGADTLAFLQGLATQDLEVVRSGYMPPTFFLNEKGRPVALAWVGTDPDGTSAWVVADGGARSALRSHFERFRIMEEVEFDGPEGMPRVIGFAGPDRASLLRDAAALLPNSTWIESAPLSFLLPAPDSAVSHLPAMVRSQGVEGSAFEAWRLAVGLPRTGIDFDLERIATELSYPEAISTTKGCYVGQEVVSRTSNRGQVRRHRVGFRFDWTGSAIPARTELRAGGVPAGYVTSTAPEPESGQGLGMGYLSVEALQTPVELLAVEGLKTTHLRVGPWPL